MSSMFLTVADMSIMASIVILAVLLVRMLLKRAPKIFSYVLWSVVLLRLLCPFALETGLSIIPKEAQAIPQEHIIEDYEYVPVLSGIFAGTNAIADSSNGGLGTILIAYDSDEYGLDGSTWASHDQVWLLFFGCLWPFGIAVLLLYSLVSYIKLHRKLIGAMPLRDNIYLADHIMSPFVMGLIRPKIYLPSSLTEKEQEYIILHEQYHIWRFDHIVKVLFFIALCIHWFNPLVWIAFVLSGKDMEMSCDEAVVKKLGIDIRADYSVSLMSLATGRRIIAGTPLAFGEGETKGRIKNLSRWKKPTVWFSIIAAFIVALVIIVCGTNKKVEGSWVEAEILDGGVEISFNLEEPIRSWAIYEDMYEDGELIFSRPRLLNGFQGDIDVTGLHEPFRLFFETPGGAGTTWRGEWCVKWQFEGGVAEWELNLSKPNYTGWGAVLASGEYRFSMSEDLQDNGEVVLYSIVLSAYPEDAVFLDDIIASNDTVIQYRLVTSTEGAENFS